MVGSIIIAKGIVAIEITGEDHLSVTSYAKAVATSMTHHTIGSTLLCMRDRCHPE